MSSSDTISDIGIDELGRLFVKPQSKEFSYIWRSAMEVHWDNDKKILYSPKPREWTYLMWYQQIISATADEYGCKLTVTAETNWHSIPDDLKQAIENLI